MDWLWELFINHCIKPHGFELSKAMGRPIWSPSEEDLMRIENAAARGLNKQQIATYINIGYSTMAKKYEEFPEIRERIKKGRDLAVAQVANELFQTALGDDKQGKIAAMIFYLKNVGGWADRQIQEGNPNKPLWVGATHKKPEEVEIAEGLSILDEAREGGTDPSESGNS